MKELSKSVNMDEVIAKGLAPCFLETKIKHSQMSSELQCLPPQLVEAPSSERLQGKRQAWCLLQVKLCDPCLSALQWFVYHARRYTSALLCLLPLYHFEGQWGTTTHSYQITSISDQFSGLNSQVHGQSQLKVKKYLLCHHD